MSAAYYLMVRLSLWFVALIAALLPAIIESLGVLSLNNNVLFRDALFVTVPAAALGLSTVLDYLCMGYLRISGTALALSALSIVFNTLSLASGIIGFLVIPHDGKPLTLPALWTFSVLIFLALFVSLVTEIYVSKDHHRCHMQPGVGRAPEPA